MIENKYKNLCRIPSDINEHLPTLSEYASVCQSVFETGVRGVVSSYALLHGLSKSNFKNKRMLMNDIKPCNVSELQRLASNDKLEVDISYKWINNLSIGFSEGETYDLTFIDTWHVYGQLKRELEKFSKITNKYIIMHDTTLDAVKGETIRQRWNAIQQSKISGIPVEEINRGIWPAVEEFLENNKDIWVLEKRFTNNNGLTIIKRVSF